MFIFLTTVIKMLKASTFTSICDDPLVASGSDNRVLRKGQCIRRTWVCADLALKSNWHHNMSSLAYVFLSNTLVNDFIKTQNGWEKPLRRNHLNLYSLDDKFTGNWYLIEVLVCRLVYLRIPRPLIIKEVPYNGTISMSWQEAFPWRTAQIIHLLMFIKYTEMYSENIS